MNRYIQKQLNARGIITLSASFFFKHSLFALVHQSLLWKNCLESAQNYKMLIFIIRNKTALTEHRASGNRFSVQPEGDLRQNDSHDAREVGLNHKIANFPFQMEICCHHYIFAWVRGGRQRETHRGQRDKSPNIHPWRHSSSIRNSWKRKKKKTAESWLWPWKRMKCWWIGWWESITCLKTFQRDVTIDNLALKKTQSNSYISYFSDTASQRRCLQFYDPWQWELPLSTSPFMPCLYSVQQRYEKNILPLPEVPFFFFFFYWKDSNRSWNGSNSRLPPALKFIENMIYLQAPAGPVWEGHVASILDSITCTRSVIFLRNAPVIKWNWYKGHCKAQISSKGALRKGCKCKCYKVNNFYSVITADAHCISVSLGSPPASQ